MNSSGAASSGPPQAGSGSARKGKTVGRYTLVKLLGEGTFAKVYKGLDAQGQEYAVKVIQKQELMKQAQGEALLYREIGVMKSLSGHRNIVKLVEILQTTNNMYLVMEIATGGELFSRIPDNGMDEPTARRYFQQLINAVKFCHEKQVAHRDIKPENLILTQEGVLKVTDFGLSNLQQINQEGNVSFSLRLKTICGTPNYVAPEVIKDDSGGYNGFVADIWSCGVVLYHLIAGHLPFRGDNVKTVLARITHSDPEPCAHMSAEARALISKLLIKDPKQRAKICDIMADPWFTVDLDLSEFEAPVQQAL